MDIIDSPKHGWTYAKPAEAPNAPVTEPEEPIKPFAWFVAILLVVFCVAWTAANIWLLIKYPVPYIVISVAWTFTSWKLHKSRNGDL